MRLLKAFIRMGCVDTVVRALQKAGAPGITISHVRGVGYDYDPEQFTFAPGVEGKAPHVAKIEVVCRREMRRWGYEPELRVGPIRAAGLLARSSAESAVRIAREAAARLIGRR